MSELKMPKHLDMISKPTNAHKYMKCIIHTVVPCLWFHGNILAWTEISIHK